jgi:hypothetical protein
MASFTLDTKLGDLIDDKQAAVTDSYFPAYPPIHCSIGAA